MKRPSKESVVGNVQVRIAIKAQTAREVQRGKVVKEIIRSFGAATTSVGETEELVEAETQQLCPIESLPTSFLSFEPDRRRNPINTPRGSTIMNEVEASLNSMESALDPHKPLYLPQGTHHLTGQALPPLLNNPCRLARGEDTAVLSITISSSSLAFQVINNNYNITNNAVPGTLEKLSRFKDVSKALKKEGLESLLSSHLVRQSTRKERHSYISIHPQMCYRRFATHGNTAIYRKHPGYPKVVDIA